MGRPKKEFSTQEEINKLLEERMKEFEKQHTPWIIMRYGCTYVGYDIKDQLTEKMMGALRELVRLMDVQYSIKYPFGDDESYYIMFEGEDKARADFIQKFFDNGYKLTWQEVVIWI